MLGKRKGFGENLDRIYDCWGRLIGVDLDRIYDCWSLNEATKQVLDDELGISTVIFYSTTSRERRCSPGVKAADYAEESGAEDGSRFAQSN